jgi:eukaryotic-like serine/threonine-protein kinase
MLLTIGDKLGPYEIVAPLGAGGMGEVWKARDTRLDRLVAIKQLIDHQGARFEQEARAVAALNHPHICQIFDIGPDYLVMEYVEGRPLSGPMSVEQAVRLALQIASAIEEAHSKGILHRDLKPSNVLVTLKGSAKLLDFGLAKHVTQSGLDVTQTAEGIVVGTAAYMSPEQAEGKPLDERSDIFSFGAVLYEMIGGRQAFSGRSIAQVLSAVLRDEPAPLEIPVALRLIIAKCLAKEPQDRFTNATELRIALVDTAAGNYTSYSASAVTGAAAVAAKPPINKRPEQPSIAVLPLANLSADKENEYFSDGLAEEILNLLAKIPGLRVIARTSSFMFRGEGQDIRRIGEMLDVRTVLEGSVQRAGSRIRVTAQLIDCGGGHHIWSDRYDRELTDVFAVQDEVAAAIAGALRLNLAGEAGLRQHKPDIRAYEAWLKGRHYARKVTPESMARSKEYFEQAIALDPDFAEAHTDLGGYYLNLWTAGLRPAKEIVPLVRAQARKAVDLSSSAAHVLLGTLAAAFDYNWTESEQHFRLFLASGESKEEARATCANYYLSPSGRIHEAVEMLEKMVQSDPLNLRSRSALANHLTIAGAYDQAIHELRKALEIDENAWFAHAALVRCYVLKRMTPEALRSAETAHRLAPWNAIVAGQFAALLVRTGDRNQSEASIQQLMRSPGARGITVGVLFYQLMCEETEAAAGWFEKAIEERDPALIPYLRHPLMKPLHSSPRWPALAKMMNLPQSLR